MAMRMYRRISDTASLTEVLRFLFDPNRSLPLIVVTHRRGASGPCFPPSSIQEAVKGAAQVYLISPVLLPEFNELLHNVFGIAPSGMRIFRTRMTLGDHHLRHPIWNEARIDQMIQEGRFLSDLLAQVVEIKRYVQGRDVLRQREPTVEIAPREQHVPRRPILRISLNG